MKKRRKEGKMGAAKKPPTYLHVQTESSAHRVGRPPANVNRILLQIWCNPALNMHMERENAGDVLTKLLSKFVQKIQVHQQK